MRKAAAQDVRRQGNEFDLTREFVEKVASLRLRQVALHPGVPNAHAEFEQQRGNRIEAPGLHQGEDAAGTRTIEARGQDLDQFDVSDSAGFSPLPARGIDGGIDEAAFGRRDPVAQRDEPAQRRGAQPARLGGIVQRFGDRRSKFGLRIEEPTQGGVADGRRSRGQNGFSQSHPMFDRQRRRRLGEFEVDRESIVSEILTQSREVAVHIGPEARPRCLRLFGDHVTHRMAQSLTDIELRRGELLGEQHEDRWVGPVGARQDDETLSNRLEHVERCGFGTLDAVPQEFERLPGHKGQRGDEMIVGPLLPGLLLDQSHHVEHGLRHPGQKIADRAGSVARQAFLQLLGHDPAEFEQCGALGRSR